MTENMTAITHLVGEEDDQAHCDEEGRFADGQRIWITHNPDNVTCLDCLQLMAENA